MLFEKRLLGTPTEEQWPGVSDLRDWHEFPQWKPQSLARVVPTLEPEGVDLLSVSSKSDVHADLLCSLKFKVLINQPKIPCFNYSPEVDPFIFVIFEIGLCIFCFGALPQYVTCLVHLLLTRFLKSISGYALKKKSVVTVPFGCFTMPLNKKLSDVLFLKKKETELTVCIHVLQKMLQLDPSNRISAIAAMEHPYFDSLDKSQF